MRNAENDNLRLLDSSYKKDLDMVKVSAANTYEHEMAKAKACIYLKKHGRRFITEAYFIGGGRADILDLTIGICYEIVKSEKPVSIDVKKEKYPLPVVIIDAEHFLEEKEENMYKYLE